MDVSDTKILVLSMPESTHRRAFMDLKLKNSGIRCYEYFNAFSGLSMRAEYESYKSWCAKNNRKTIRDGLPGYGCLMSYKALFLSINPISHIVLEDDVYLHKRFFDIVDLLPSDTLDRYDLLYFGHNSYEFSERHMDAIRSGEPLVPMQKETMTYGTYGIMYGPKAVKHLKGVMSGMSHDSVRPADHLIWIHAVHHLRSAMINPPLVIPEVRTSTIREGRNMAEWCKSRLINMDDYSDVEKYVIYAEPSRNGENLGTDLI